jgi:O-antigen/teichoic acid export membrane protein
MHKVKKFLFQNTTTKQTILKNTIWLFLGEILGRILKLILVVFATRKLGVEGWGIFSYGLAFIGFFYFLGDFGVNTFLTREMSKNNSSKYKYLSTALIIKIILLSIFFLASIILGPNLGKIKLDLSIVIIFSIFSVSESLREFGLAINRSLEKMEREGFSKILVSLLITCLGIFLILKNTTPLSLIMAYTIGSIISTFYIFWSIRDELKQINWVFSKENLKIIFDFSWPLIIISLFSFIFSIDSVMLGQIKSAAEVGLFSASVRLVSVMTIIPSFIATSLFPILSKSELDKEKSTLIFEKIMIIVIGIAIPITIGGVIFSQKIILSLLGPAYLEAVPVLNILMITILASFPDIILNNMIYSKNLQKIFLKTTSLGLIVSLILNLCLIPIYGAAGAAVSTTVSQLLIVTLNWRKLNTVIQFNVISKLGKIIISSIFMAIIIQVCNIIGMNFIITIIISICVYALSLNILKEPAFREVLLMVGKN